MKTTLTALALVVGLWAARPAAAGPITTPAGLNPGDQFRVLFVSSARRDGTSTNVADYDTFVANLANAAGLTYNGAAVTWHAVVSTPTVEANSSTRLPVSASSPALYRLDGVKVADSTADLWDASLDAPINVTELGGTAATPLVWTGTLSNGARAAGLALGDSSGFALTGRKEGTDFSWTDAVVSDLRLELRLYGYSEVLTVPGTAAVPEPTSLTLLAVGIAGLAGTAAARRRRRASPAP